MCPVSHLFFCHPPTSHHLPPNSLSPRSTDIFTIYKASTSLQRHILIAGYFLFIILDFRLEHSNQQTSTPLSESRSTFRMPNRAREESHIRYYTPDLLTCQICECHCLKCLSYFIPYSLPVQVSLEQPTLPWVRIRVALLRTLVAPTRKPPQGPH